MLEKYVVPIEELRNQCDPNIFPYDSTLEWDVKRELIGQERALEALQYGLSMKRKGYNIYVSGYAGTGRSSYSYLVSKDFAQNRPRPNDWCYVYNFNKPNSPKALSLSPGEGISFKEEVEKAIKNIDLEVPKVLNSKEFDDSKNKIFNENKKMAEDILGELNLLAKSYNFVFKQTDKGILNLPLIDNRPMTDEEMDRLTDEEIDILGENSLELTQRSFEYMKKIKAVEDKMKEEMKKLIEEYVFLVATSFIGPIQVRFRNNESVNSFLQDLKTDLVKNHDILVEEDKEASVESLLFPVNKKEDFLKRYQVNLFIDNMNTSGGPIIRETNPNYYHLFGKIEYGNEMGVATTDHMRIKPGSMHEANGGYIIIQLKDIIQKPTAWNGLKRAIASDELKIENLLGENLVSETLSPEPIPLDIKVILVGDYMSYSMPMMRTLGSNLG